MPHNPQAIVFLGDTRDLHHHGCEAVVAEILQGMSDAGIPPTAVLAGLNWKPDERLCLDAALVIVNGEGALHHSRPLVPLILELAEKRREHNRPTALINSSWFSNSAELTSRLIAFDFVCARDPQSAREIATHSPTPMLVPDQAIAYAARHLPPSPPSPDGRLMVGDSTIPRLTRDLRGLAARRGWDYLPVLARPTTPRPGKKSRKIQKHYRLARRLGPLARWLLSPRHHAHLVGEVDTGKYLQRISNCQGVVTGRFHTVCMAIGLQSPFLAVGSNTPKIEALLIDAGLDPVKRMVPADKLAEITDVPPFSPEELEAVKTYAQRVREQSSLLYNRLSGMI